MKSFDFKGKKVLIRVDFNVPQDENLAVTDNSCGTDNQKSVGVRWNSGFDEPFRSSKRCAGTKNVIEGSGW
jgi:hypothetical protein